MIDDNIKDLEKMSVEDRNQYIRLRTESQRLELLEKWSESISLEDLALVEQPYRALIQDMICGNSQRGLPPMGRIFTIEPTGKGSVWIQTGFKRSKRTYREISVPTALPAELAIAAFCQWGPMSKIQQQRSFLQEHDPEAPKPKKRRTNRKKAKKKPEIVAEIQQG